MSEMVPKGWFSKKLKEVSILTKGLTYKSSDYSDKQNGLPFLTLKSISRNGGYSPVGLKFYKGKYKEHHLLSIGDILFANTDLTRNGDVVGNPLFFDGFILDKTILYSMDLSKLNVDPQNIHSKFLYYLLMTHRVKRYMVNSSAGSTVLHLDTSRVKELDLNIPPLTEQKKISSILTSVDEMINKNQSQINKLQDLKKGTMNELLTKGIGHTEFKDSELGRIPKIWELGLVDDYSTIVTNGFVGSVVKYYRSEGIPYLVSKNIRDNYIDETGLTYITEEFHEKTAKSKLKIGDLLTVQSGHVGSSAVVSKKFDGANCHALILTRFKQDLINSDFVAYYFNSQIGRLRLSKYFVGSTIVHLNTSDLKKFKFPIPDLSEQCEIVKTIKSIEHQITCWTNKLSQTQSLKKSLMQNLLTGKVRVTVN